MAARSPSDSPEPRRRADRRWGRLTHASALAAAGCVLLATAGPVSAYIPTHDALDRRTEEWQHLDVHGRIRTREQLPAEFATPPYPAAGAGQLRWTVGYGANGNPERRSDPRGVAVVTTFGVLDRKRLRREGATYSVVP